MILRIECTLECLQDENKVKSIYTNMEYGMEK